MEVALMKIQFADLWRWDGTVNRGTYAALGLVGFAFKHNLDRIVATQIFHRPWGVFNYWAPLAKSAHINSLSRDEAWFLATMLLTALPFIWVGVVLTLRRLRDAGLSTALVAFFFLPFLNVLFFLMLSILPSRPEAGALAGPRSARVQSLLERLIPDHAWGSAAMAVLLTLPFGMAATALGVTVFKNYGWSLFVALPFCLGLGAALLHGYHRPRSFINCLLVSWFSIVVLGGALVALAVEGLICLAMALPLGMMLASVGAIVGYLIQRRPVSKAEAPAMMLLLLCALPGLMGAEWASQPELAFFEVRTALEIQAAPEDVWRHLIAFPDAPAPVEWLFRSGVAYPIRSSIRGAGVGARRECLFSTGTFVEPIEAWEEARLLKFSVSSGPPTMREWTPYQDIHPPHLDGYLLAEQAEFRLTPLAGGRTRLEGISRYRNRMWPAPYWRLWSDHIIHSIHRRVFRHIQRLAEQPDSMQAARQPG